MYFLNTVEEMQIDLINVKILSLHKNNDLLADDLLYVCLKWCWKKGLRIRYGFKNKMLLYNIKYLL